MTNSFHSALPNPEDREEAGAQAPVALAAPAFLKTVVEQKDLKAASGAMEPRLRASWAAAWVEANSSSLTQAGHDLVEARAALSGGQFGHELWPHFSRVTTREVASLLPSNREWWGIGVTPRDVGMDLELLYLHDTGGRSDAVWMPGETKPVVPILMHYSGEAWQVLNVGGESIPD